jgi:VWFA-related protein
MKPLPCSGAALCAALALASSLAAQQPSAAPPPVFGEEIDVRVVNVEVVVTDREGQRVPGLKPDDFRLRVDGKDVPIEYFTEVREGRSIAAAAEGGTTKPPAGDLPSVKPEGAVGTYYLVFIDDYFAIAPHRDAVLKSLKADLARLGPEDRMAIVAYDGGRLALLSSWSGSQADLGRAFDQAMARTARGFDRVTERRTFLRDEAFAGKVVGDNAPLDLNVATTGLNERERAYGETLVRQVEGAVGAAVSAMRGFTAPQGRKVMLLLSGGWPFSARSYVTGGDKGQIVAPGGGAAERRAGSTMPSRELSEGEDSLRSLTSTANLLGYTLYPVDVPGVQTTAADAETEAPSTSGFENLQEQEIEGTLHFLAKETGGKPLLNSNRAGALPNASSDTRSYYWLGFSPAWQRNDKVHEIKVVARRSGLEVRSRTGFLDLSRQAEVSMKVESALLFGKFPGALPLPMRLGPPVRSKQGDLEIPVTLGLPVNLMTIVPLDGKYAAQLELRFAASDSQGNRSEIPVLPLNLSSEKLPTPGKHVRYDTTFTLHGKADHVVVAVYDPLSGRIATAEADIAPAPLALEMK